jgi:hypothetical protein
VAAQPAKNAAKTVILLQLLREGAMSKALDYIKAALQIAFSLVVLAIILLNFRGISVAIQNILQQAASISAVEFYGLKLNFTATTVDTNLKLEYTEADFKKLGVDDSAAYKSRVLALIHGLDSKEFVRLMYVGQLKNLCEFENPSTEMRNAVALDYGLRDKGLTRIEVSPATLELVRVNVAKLAAQGKSLDIGYPRGCYDMTLAEDGYNVKTVLVNKLSVAFDGGRTAPP